MFISYCNNEQGPVPLCSRLISKSQKAYQGPSYSLTRKLTNWQKQTPGKLFSETCKYLFLLFDTDNHINKNNERYLFTTEGHVFPIREHYQRKVWEEDLLYTSRNRLYGDSAAELSANLSATSSSCENSRSINSPHVLPLKKTYLDQIFSQFGIDIWDKKWYTTCDRFVLQAAALHNLEKTVESKNIFYQSRQTGSC